MKKSSQHDFLESQSKMTHLSPLDKKRSSHGLRGSQDLGVTGKSALDMRDQPVTRIVLNSNK